MLSFYPIYIKTLFLRGKKIENAHFQGKKRTLLGKKIGEEKKLLILHLEIRRRAPFPSEELRT